MRQPTLVSVKSFNKYKYNSSNILENRGNIELFTSSKSVVRKKVLWKNNNQILKCPNLENIKRHVVLHYVVLRAELMG